MKNLIFLFCFLGSFAYAEIATSQNETVQSEVMGSRTEESLSKLNFKNLKYVGVWCNQADPLKNFEITQHGQIRSEYFGPTTVSVLGENKFSIQTHEKKFLYFHSGKFFITTSDTLYRKVTKDPESTYERCGPYREA